jgi:hypothetical protein
MKPPRVARGARPRSGPCAALLLALLVAAPAAAGQAAATRATTSPPPLDNRAAAGTAAAPGTVSHGLRKAIIGSLRLLLVEHGTRIAFQPKTRRELGGPFLKDYRRSVKLPRTWEDGDRWYVNYIGHPIHGAAAGFVWRQNHGDASSRTFGASGAYWASLARAGAWIGVYSFEFEFGPLSEASIGNVGLHANTTGWVDHAVTPLVGFGMMAAEDALDRYFIAFVDRHVGFRPLRIACRIIFNPARSLANAVDGHAPWYRADRPLREP